MKFVVFGEDWGQHPSSTQHLFKIIGQEQQVYWFNSIGLRTPKLNWKDLKRVGQKLSLIISAKRREKTTNVPLGFNLLNPKLLPWHLNKQVCKFNRVQVKKALAEALLDPEPIIYWVSLPTAVRVIEPRPQDKVIYYCGDDFSGLAGVDHHMAEITENELIEKADRIFVASASLLAKMPENKTQLLEHGVDFDLFGQKVSKHPAYPNAENVIGFYGSISDWMDKKLMMFLAKSRPTYTFLLVGEIRTELNELLAEPNVIHVPPVPHQELPQFSSHWQVGIMPFVDNKQIRACNPLKLKEYLVSGKPVVTTRFPAAEKYKQSVLIANSKQGFLERIDYAIALSRMPNLDWKRVSRAQVETHCWQNKVQFLKQSLSF